MIVAAAATRANPVGILPSVALFVLVPGLRDVPIRVLPNSPGYGWTVLRSVGGRLWRCVYAASKSAGGVVRARARHYELRVESLFGGGVNGPRTDGRRPGSSLDRIADALLEGREVWAFGDRVVSPSYVEDVAAATVSLLRAAPAHGLYHCVGSGHATWLDVAAALAGELGVEPVIRGITLDELELRAPRPRFCALSNRKLAAAGVAMPHWRDAVARYAGIRLRFGPC